MSYRSDRTQSGTFTMRSPSRNPNGSPVTGANAVPTAAISGQFVRWNPLGVAANCSGPHRAVVLSFFRIEAVSNAAAGFPSAPSTGTLCAIIEPHATASAAATAATFIFKSRITHPTHLSPQKFTTKKMRRTILRGGVSVRRPAIHQPGARARGLAIKSKLHQFSVGLST